MSEDNSSAAEAAPFDPAAGVFDAAWSALQHSELIEIKTVRRKLSFHELRTFFSVVVPLVSEASNAELLSVLKKLTFMARASGGTAGRDGALCEACDAAEAIIVRLRERQQS